MSGPQCTIETFTLLDDGSTVSLITRQMARRLGLQGRKISIRLKRINDREAVTIPCERVNFVFDVDGQKFGMTGAIAVPELH